jgi:hypothetical protein
MHRTLCHSWEILALTRRYSSKCGVFTKHETKICRFRPGPIISFMFLAVSNEYYVSCRTQVQSQLTRRAWFSASMLSKNTRRCSRCCSTCGCFARILRMSETMACTIVKPFLYSATLNELLKNTEVLHKPCQMQLIKEVLIQKYDRKWERLVWQKESFRNWAAVSTNLISYSYLINVKMAYSKVCLDAPVGLLCQMCTASRSSPRITVGDHQPTCCKYFN